MTTPRPLGCVWDGEAFVPKSPRFADRYYVVGETYMMAPHEERSTASHGHYFAALNEGWKNLRENDAERFPTPEHLRKRALVDAGFYDEEIIDCGTNKIAPVVGAAIRKRDDFAIIYIRDQFVIVRTAKSQSVRAMGKKEFEASKTAVLEIVANMVGVKTETLKQETDKAA